ncbi:conserved hypothetical protein [Gloeothece citriformis PCC 7424]|uniref:Uncharacterized protein n=1 Tax=Gloeothece citriformis (strain PCC 7424) TaxID=65393 RepID=B7KGG7_GLOC7|nr:hypothetical protein [Gloeothece citriformis]ACK70638.1 conserved hypothetical protein [Gloeothece citriformis PCC 7424]
MSLLSIDELKTLVEHSQGLCVSLYMPTYTRGAETRQNPIRFKNLIKQAQEYLQEEYHLDRNDAVNFVQPAMDLDKEEFWQHQDEGLAIFVGDNFFQYYRLPLNFNELVVVSDRFHLKPLMPLLTGDGEFYILALSQKEVRLFMGTRDTIKEIEMENVPHNMTEALQYDEPENSLQNRISTSRGGTNNSFQQTGVFHGQGSPDTDDNRRNILQFFLQLDRGVQDYITNKQAPLVLMGVDYLLPIYQEANTYQHLLEDAITGNPKTLGAEELHTQVWPIVEPYFTQSQKKAIDQYQELVGVGRASSNLKEVVSAACYGRVAELFVAVGKQQWGNFDPQADQLQIHEQPEPGDEDLLNLASVQTFLNGGTIYAVEPEKVPEGASLAAVFRY